MPVVGDMGDAVGDDGDTSTVPVAKLQHAQAERNVRNGMFTGNHKGMPGGGPAYQCLSVSKKLSGLVNER